MWQSMSEGSAGTPCAATGHALLAAEQAQLARLRRQVDERWRALALASARPAQSAESLERLYDAYIRAVEAYLARQRALNSPREDRRRAS